MSRRFVEGLISFMLILVMLLFLAFVVIPDAKGSEPPKAKVLLEIRDEKVTVFEYETDTLICNIAIVKVSMIGSQATVTCVGKDRETYRSDRERPIPLRPLGSPEQRKD